VSKKAKTEIIIDEECDNVSCTTKLAERREPKNDILTNIENGKVSQVVGLVGLGLQRTAEAPLGVATVAEEQPHGGKAVTFATLPAVDSSKENACVKRKSFAVTPAKKIAERVKRATDAQVCSFFICSLGIYVYYNNS